MLPLAATICPCFSLQVEKKLGMSLGVFGIGGSAPALKGTQVGRGQAQSKLRTRASSGVHMHPNACSLTAALSALSPPPPF